MAPVTPATAPVVQRAPQAGPPPSTASPAPAEPAATMDSAIARAKSSAQLARLNRQPTGAAARPPLGEAPPLPVLARTPRPSPAVASPAATPPARMQRADDEQTPKPVAPPPSDNPLAELPFFNSDLDDEPQPRSRPRSQSSPPPPVRPTPPPTPSLMEELPFFNLPTDDEDEEPAPSQRPEAPEGEDEGDKVMLDLEKLAQDVLPYVKRMLLVERERRTRR